MQQNYIFADSSRIPVVIRVVDSLACRRNEPHKPNALSRASKCFRKWFDDIQNRTKLSTFPVITRLVAIDVINAIFAVDCSLTFRNVRMTYRMAPGALQIIKLVSMTTTINVTYNMRIHPNIPIIYQFEPFSRCVFAMSTTVRWYANHSTIVVWVR